MAKQKLEEIRSRLRDEKDKKENKGEASVTLTESTITPAKPPQTETKSVKRVTFNEEDNDNILISEEQKQSFSTGELS